MILVRLMHGNVILSCVIQVGFIWSKLIRLAVSQVNQIQNFGLQFFNFKTFIAPSVFENIVSKMVLTSPWIITCHVPVGEIQQPPEREACTVDIWDYDYDGSLWIHPSAVINIPNGSPASSISTTLQTPKEWLFPITVPIWSLSSSGLWLVE